MIYKKRLHFVTLFCLLVFYSCSTVSSYKIKGNEVTYPEKNGQLQIVVCKENIMQVKYTLADAFDTKKSLFLEDNAFSLVKYDVNENDQEIVISTKKLKAKIANKPLSRGIRK